MVYFVKICFPDPIIFSASGCPPDRMSRSEAVWCSTLWVPLLILGVNEPHFPALLYDSARVRTYNPPVSEWTLCHQDTEALLSQVWVGLTKERRITGRQHKFFAKIIFPSFQLPGSGKYLTLLGWSLTLGPWWHRFLTCRIFGLRLTRCRDTTILAPCPV